MFVLASIRRLLSIPHTLPKGLAGEGRVHLVVGEDTQPSDHSDRAGQRLFDWYLYLGQKIIDTVLHITLHDICFAHGLFSRDRR